MAFNLAIKKIEQVRNISSPILKVITVQRMFSEIMAAMMGVANQRGVVAEADYLITVVFYILCSLKSTEAKFLGARFLEECTYVDEFMHEEQVGVVEEYVNFEHMKIVLDVLQKGLSHTEKYLIR